MIAQEAAGRGDNGTGEKGSTATVDFPDFLDIMTTRMAERDSEQEISKAFLQFSGNKDHISLADLKQMAKELGENMSEDELKEMMFEANKTDRDGIVLH